MPSLRGGQGRGGSRLCGLGALQDQCGGVYAHRRLAEEEGVLAVPAKNAALLEPEFAVLAPS
jgi:hypothetical protein